MFSLNRAYVDWEAINRFPFATGVDGPEVLKSVHPLMQRNVKSVLDVIGEYNVVVILFGSAITCRCSVYSDIDIAILSPGFNLSVYYELQAKIRECVDCDADVVYLNELDPNSMLCKEILQTGIILKGGEEWS